MKNYLSPGEVVTIACPAGGVSSGDPVLVGDLFGVATHDAAATEDLELCRVGRHTLPKTTGAGTGFSAGDRALFDVSAKKFAANAGAADDVYVGIVCSDAADDDTTVDVVLVSPKVRPAETFAAGEYTITAADATANAATIATGLASIAGQIVQVIDAGNNVVTADADVTDSAGDLIVADGATYNTVEGYKIRWLAW